MAVEDWLCAEEGENLDEDALCCFEGSGGSGEDGCGRMRKWIEARIRDEQQP